jgi:hypothetical protein
LENWRPLGGHRGKEGEMKRFLAIVAVLGLAVAAHADGVSLAG